MSIRTKEYLKSRFNTGDKPTEQDFADLIDTMFSMSGGGPGPGPGDPPALVSANIYTANKSEIVLEFDKDLNPSFLATNASFSASLGRTVTGRSITGRFLRLTVSSPYAQGDAVTIGYTQGADALRDTESTPNYVASFDPQVVSNNISNAAGTFPTEAILILGYDQSNGIARADANPANEVTVPLDCWEYRLSTNNISHFQEPSGEGDAAATVRSPYAAMASKLNQLTGKPIIVVKYGKGNTGISQFTDDTNVIYTNAKAGWDGLVNFCATNSEGPITIIGAYMHFLQGENDAGSLEVDGYMVQQNLLVDRVKADFAPISSIFLTRIGYDSTFTSAANSEKIMKAKNYAVLQRDELVMGSIAPASFTTGNGKLKGDLVHYTLLGCNQVGNEVAESMYYLRQNNAKKFWAENVTALQDPVGYFDDIYPFRSLIPGSDRTNYNEMYGRNNLTKEGPGATGFVDVSGLDVGGSAELNPAIIRTLTNTHDWTVELTFSMSTSDGMPINGNRGSWTEDWLFINSTSSIQLKGNNVTKSVSMSGVDFSNTTNLAIVYTYSDNTVKVYVDKALKDTFSDWAFTSWKLESFFRGYQATPNIIFEGLVQRIRIVKRALAPYEFDTTVVSSSPAAVDLHFDFDNSIAEVGGAMTTQAILYSSGATTIPLYTGTSLDLDQSWYVLLSQKVELPDNWTVEWEGTRANDSTIAFVTGPLNTPTSGGFGGKIGFDLGDVIVNGTYITPGVSTLGSHTYKLENDKTANELRLFVDNSLVHTGTAIATQIDISMIGSGHPNPAYNYEGTLRFLKIKSFI